jgi:hypothetical protein
VGSNDEEQTNDKDEKNRERRKRTARLFPAGSFSESLEFAQRVYEFGSGNAVRRLSLFNHIGKSPDSSASRQLITNSNKYGLTRGSYTAEQIELTTDGAQIFNERVSEKDRVRLKIKLGIQSTEQFNTLYEKLIGNKLPAKAALIDMSKAVGVPEDQGEEFIDTFIVNLKSLGLLTVISGADRIVSVDHVVDSVSHSGVPNEINYVAVKEASPKQELVTTESARFERTCFYISPIGEEGSEPRLHSDLFLGSLIEPVLDTFKLEVVRADKIDKPGFITKQIIEYLARSRIVIADLSFHNPNIFYELAIRHALRKPIVQIIRKGDRIPFDVNQSRTIIIDNSSVYAMVPMIDAYRAEIANQVRRALEADFETDTPLSLFYPNFSAKID